MIYIKRHLINVLFFFSISPSCMSCDNNRYVQSIIHPLGSLILLMHMQLDIFFLGEQLIVLVIPFVYFPFLGKQSLLK